IPVTNTVSEAQSNASLSIRFITSPMHTAPRTADVPRAAADVMGIPPTSRITPDGSVGSVPDEFFLEPYVFALFLPRSRTCIADKLPTFSRTKPAVQEGGF